MSEADERARARRISVGDGLFYAAMVGLAESYLGTFAVELGHGPAALAVLGTLPLLLGAFGQLASSALSRWLGSRRRFVVLGALLQAACCAGFAAVAYLRSESLAVLLSLKLVFWSAGLAVAPPWSDWMASVVPEPLRARYFGARSGAIHVVLLLAFGAGGWALQGAGGRWALFDRYQWLFVAAALARAASAWLIAVQPDPEAARGPVVGSGPARLRRALSRGEWRTALYLAALMFGAYIAVPFFTPYMLAELQLSYGAFAGLTALSVLTKAGGFALCPRLSARIGLRGVLVAAGVAIAIIPAVWALSRDLRVLLAAQALSGLAWAGLEYASFQLLLAAAPADARTEFFSLASGASGIAQLAGGLWGSQLLVSASLGYEDVFWLSAALRGLALAVLILGLRHLTLPVRAFRFAMRIISVRPAGGTLGRPVAPSQPPPKLQDVP